MIKFMQNLNEVFKRIQDRKREQKQIRAIYKDALESNNQYLEVLEQLKSLNDKKKKIVAAVQIDFKEELDKLEEIKLNIVSDNQLLLDISLHNLFAAQTVKIIDEYKVEYEPKFSVKFKRR